MALSLGVRGMGKEALSATIAKSAPTLKSRTPTNADSVLKCHGCGKIGVIRPRCPICSNPQVRKSNSAGSILRCHGCGKIGVIRPECPVCSNKPTHKSYSQGLATVNKLVSASVIRRLRRKRKMQLAKARLAAARGTSKTAADAADATSDKSFASVGPSQRTLSPKYRQATSNQMTKLEHDQDLTGTCLPWQKQTQLQPQHLDTTSTNTCPLVVVGPVVNNKDYTGQ